ncbi:MAG TPA: hypothetical protein VFY17_10730 [Pilimelia sp.]|nr:hypothetical protein [Pilimelia sp.]
MGLEVWLTGTHTELGAAVTALTAAGRIAYTGPPQPLVGADAGRCRQYLRLAVPAPPAARPVGRAAAVDAVPLDFAA